MRPSFATTRPSRGNLLTPRAAYAKLKFHLNSPQFNDAATQG